jgi:hypothetical protein
MISVVLVIKEIAIIDNARKITDEIILKNKEAYEKYVIEEVLSIALR